VRTACLRSASENRSSGAQRGWKTGGSFMQSQLLSGLALSYGSQGDEPPPAQRKRYAKSVRNISRFSWCLWISLVVRRKWFQVPPPAKKFSEFAQCDPPRGVLNAQPQFAMIAWLGIAQRPPKQTGATFARRREYVLCTTPPSLARKHGKCDTHFRQYKCAGVIPLKVVPTMAIIADT